MSVEMLYELDEETIIRPKQKSQPTRIVERRKRGIDEAHAQKLRTRLKAFAADWERSEMSAYDEL